MKSQYFAMGLLLASAGVIAQEIGVKGGSDFFAAAINSQKTAPGLQYGIEYVNAKHQSELVDANLGYGVAMGALRIIPRVGVFWAELNHDKSSSFGANAGIRAMAPLPQANHTWLYLDFSMSPNVGNYNLEHLHQFEAGIYYQPAHWLTLSSGYRYLGSGLSSNTTHRSVDGLFLGAAWRF
ncbi:YfaZ family protein [Pantoea sp. JK]|uniref:YfaZ family protein n=1 Tax=Pantoea sp. JK TaxID=2871703 RepID=UPI002238C76C|nr:YfaZ family protein [Pantoea sp. JK]MCW6032825.1 YfaZ family protein [Pantoea sp. JK]